MKPINPTSLPVTPDSVEQHRVADASCPDIAQQELVAGLVGKLMHRIDVLEGQIDMLTADTTHLTAHTLGLYQENRHDFETGLLNKRGFNQAGNSLIEQGKPFALFIADLMSLKAINDQLGHNAGDRVIDDTGKVLKFGMTFLSMFTVLGIKDDPIVARLGGDEYGLIVPLEGINELASEQLETAEDGLEFLNNSHSRTETSDYKPVIRHTGDQLKRARRGELTYQDAVTMIYGAVQRLYKEEYLANSQDPDFGQGIALGGAIFDPETNPDATLKSLKDEADIEMYADKAMQQLVLGTYDRRTKQRTTPDRRSNTDRREADRRSGIDRRVPIQIGRVSILPTTGSIHPPKM